MSEFHIPEDQSAFGHEAAEAAEAALYGQLLRDFGATAMHPQLSRPLTWGEAEAGWPGDAFEGSEGWTDDFSVGRQRWLTLKSGPVDAKVALYVFDSKIMQTSDLDSRGGLPVGSLYVETSGIFDPEHPGALNGVVLLHQNPVVEFDFGHDTRPAPAHDPEIGEALVEITEYLGFNTAMVTHRLADAQDDEGLIGTMNTSALERFAGGMQRLARDSQHANDIVI